MAVNYLPKLDSPGCEVSKEFYESERRIGHRKVDTIEPYMVPIWEIISFVCARFDLRCIYKTPGGREKTDGSDIISDFKCDIERLAHELDAVVGLQGHPEELYIDFRRMGHLRMLDLGAGSLDYHYKGSRCHEPWLIRALSPFMDAWGIDRKAPHEDGMIRANFENDDFLHDFPDGSVDIVYTANAFDWNSCPWVGDLERVRENAGREILRVTHSDSVLYFINFYRRRATAIKAEAA